MSEHTPRDCVTRKGTPKVQYGTWGEAEKGLRRTRRRNIAYAEGLHIYRCPDCHRYHLGHEEIADD